MLLGCCLSFCLAHVASLPQDGQLTLLRHVRVLNADASGFSPEGYVVLQGERILRVGSGAAPEEFEAGLVLEGGGGYLIPGLIDAHVHLASVPGMNGAQVQRHPELARVWFEQLPRSLLYHGYTTVLELGGRSRALEAVQAAPWHPDVLHCDHPLVLANGYGMTFEPLESRFANHPNFLYDPRQAEAIPDSVDPEAHTPAATVGRVARNGGVCVKIHHEDGFGGTFSWPTPSEEMLGQVIEHAHAQGLPVVLHANSLAAWEFGASVGVDQFVHGLWHWGDLNRAPGLPPRITAVLDRVLEQGQGVMPTLRVVFGEADMLAPSFLDDPQLAHVVPGELLAWYATPEGQWFREDLEGLYRGKREMLRELGFERLESDEDLLAVMRMFHSQVERTVAYLAQREGRLLFGSDTPSAPMYANPAGYNGYLEMQRWHAVGVPLRDILAAATIRNAEAFALDDELGSIEPGKLAHLLLLGENPLESIEAYDTIGRVVVRGRVVPRAALSASTKR